MRETRKILSILLAAALILGAGSAAWSFGNKALKAPTKASEAADGSAAMPAIPDDAPVAVANGRPITKKQFDLAIRAYMQNVQNQMGGKHSAETMAPTSEIKNDVLQQMVERELLYEEIEKHEFEGIDAKVDAEFAQALGSFPDEAAFDAYLGSQGISQADLRILMKRKLSLQEYFTTKIIPTINISDEQVGTFYKENPELFERPERVRASHILIGTKPEFTEEQKAEAKKKAEDVKARIAAGEDFAALALEHSDCPSSKDGGDLNYFAKGQMVPEFEAAAYALEVGSVSDVVETQFGYHVIKTTEHEQPGTVALEEVKERIADHLKKKEANEVMKTKVEELVAAAKIDILIPHL